MSDPPAFGDPDKMSSANYDESEEDNGGVHHNSGVNSKAVFLMVDGGSFNGKTVTALGWTKTAAIYYEVNTNLLSSGADYSDLYYALQQACTNLIGQKGITARRLHRSEGRRGCRGNEWSASAQLQYRGTLLRCR